MKLTTCVRAFALAAACLLPGAQAAASFDEGIEYQLVTPAQPTANADKLEVVELFWYGCPHCFELEPALDQWLENRPEDVEFVRIPAIFSAKWEVMAKAYYALEVMGKLDELHKPMFHALHEKRRKLDTEQQITAFVAEHGVSPEEFGKAMKSFAVATKVGRARVMTRRYGITGVPALIVNGKYRTSGSQAGNNATMLQVVDHLLEQERKQAGGDPEEALAAGEQ